MIARFRPLAHALRRDDRGATLVEFALIAPPFLLLMMGALDAGYGMYLRSVAAGTLENAARAASLEGATESQFDLEVRRAIRKIMPNYAQDDENIEIVKKNYTDYSRIDAAEKLTVDVDDDGILDSGDCFLDEDGNGEFGVNEGASGMGGPDDSVFYTVNLSLPRLFPLYSMIGLPANQTVSVKTLVINQPFGAQAVRTTVCKA